MAGDPRAPATLTSVQMALPAEALKPSRVKSTPSEKSLLGARQLNLVALVVGWA